MDKWISVKDRLPELSTSVLCIVKNHVGKIQVVLTRELTTHDGIIKWFANFAFKPIPGTMEECQFPVINDETAITHWMPLPKMPNE